MIPPFPESLDDVVDERALELSYRLNIEIVPTLIQVENGEEQGAPGWLAARGLAPADRICPNSARN